MKKLSGKLLIIGLDGGTYDVLDRLVDDGVMPNLKIWIEKGFKGILRSTFPPTTPTAWSSMITGVNPGKHGIFDFRQPPVAGNSKRDLIDGYSLKAPPFWRILGRHGKKTGLLNLPIIYPPLPIDGFMVTGMMTPSTELPFTYPHKLQTELLGQIGEYVIDLKTKDYDAINRDDVEHFIDKLVSIFIKRKEAFYYLFNNKDWECFMSVFVLPDRIMHKLWKYIDPNSKLYYKKGAKEIRHKVWEAFATLDSIFGELNQYIENGLNAFVVSDHGFGTLDGHININKILKDKKFVAFKEGLFWKSHVIQLIRKTKKLMLPLLPTGLSSKIKLRLKKKMQDVLKIRPGAFGDGIESYIDWKETKAYFSSVMEQGIYVIEKDANNKEHIINEIVKVLNNIKVNGKCVINKVVRKDDIYHGDYLENSPDILFSFINESLLGVAGLTSPAYYTDFSMDPRGFHVRNGIFLGIGPAIKASNKIDTFNIMDIAPTILFHFNCPILPSMDGKVMTDIYTQEFLEGRKIKIEDITLDDQHLDLQSEDEDKNEIRKLLENLGYMC